MSKKYARDAKYMEYTFHPRSKQIAWLLVFLVFWQLVPIFALSAGAPDPDTKDETLNGTGTVIAVIGGGFESISEKSASAYFTLTDKSRIALTKNKLSGLSPSLKAEGRYTYVGEKIPFLYNYAENTVSFADSGTRGMTIAALAAANYTGTSPDKSYYGKAPEAQLVMMQIYDETGAYTEESFCNAFADAITLGADVIFLDMIQLSGTDDGTEYEEYVKKAIRDAHEAGIVVVCPAGDGGTTGTSSLYNYEYGIMNPRCAYPDYGTVASPSAISGVYSIASRDEAVYKALCITYGGGSKTAFTDTTKEYLPGGKTFTRILDGQTLEYVAVGGIGAESDYEQLLSEGIDVEGKIALIRRGELSFTEKVNTAASYGAVGAIIYDNIPNSISKVLMAMPDVIIPAIFVSYESGVAMKESDVKTVAIKDGDFGVFANSSGGGVSFFSSRGTTPDLAIKPELTTEGGNVAILSFERNAVSVTAASSTAYAAANMAGQLACMLEYANQNNIALDPDDLKVLTMNAAAPIIDPYGAEYSPRAQGAGLISAEQSVFALHSLLYSMDGGAKLELGNIGNIFKLTFKLKNITDLPHSYDIGVTVAGDGYTTYTLDKDSRALETGKNGSTDYFPYFVSPNANLFRKARVSVTELFGNGNNSNDVDMRNYNKYSENASPYLITLQPGEEKKISFYVSLHELERKEYAKIFPNGYFIEGFVYARSDDQTAPVCSIPYTGFFGNFQKLSAFEKTVYEQDSFDSYGKTKFYSWVDDGNQMFSYTLGMNLFAEAQERWLSPDHIAFSPNGDGYGDALYAELSLLRNVRDMSVTLISADTGKNLFTTEYDRVFQKTGLSNLLKFMVWDGCAEDNSEYVYPEGKYIVRINATPCGGSGIQSMSIPFVLDSTKPEPVSYEILENDGQRTLILKLSDNHHIQAVNVYESSNKQIGNFNVFYAVKDSDRDHNSGIYTCSIDITDISGDNQYLYAEISDYALNSNTVRIKLP